jgi:protoheme IX farnesyltransferase
VFNNYTDRDIDAKMERTKKRALVAHTISETAALVFARVLLLAGIVSLYLGTNGLTVTVALVGFSMYLFVYSMWAKRTTVHATLIGAIAGAVPPVIGYTAVTGALDIYALILFLVLVSWQMPHFLAISLFRKEEYAAASIPVMPLVRGEDATKKVMMLYTGVFGLAALSLYALNAVGEIYLVSMAAITVFWLGLGYKGFHLPDTVRWARRMFFFSLFALLVFSILIAIDWK